VKLTKKPVPLYHQLEQVLRKRIFSGQFDPDRPFPTEKDLCEDFGVSRTTVRQAMMSLESDGLIRREQGRGTFVNRRPDGAPRYELYGTVEDLFFLGAGTRLELSSKTLIRAEAGTADEMQLEPGDRLWLFEGFRHIGEHAAFFQAYVPESIGREIDIEEQDGPLFIQRVERSALETARRAVQVTSAAVADERLARMLKIKPGHPLLVIKRVYFSRTGRALEMAVTHCPGDAYQNVAELVRVKA